MKISSKLLIAGGIVLALGVGLVLGFIGGVLATKAGRAGFTSLLENERPAQVAQPRVLAREQFQLQYPANWKLDREAKDFDPDHAFRIESPGSAFIMFRTGKATFEPEATLREYIAIFSKLMDRPTSTRFTQWGGFTGQGIILHGRVLGISTTIKPFVFNQDGVSVIVVQHYLDEDQQAVLPGLKLVERTFTLKPVLPKKAEP